MVCLLLLLSSAFTQTGSVAQVSPRAVTADLTIERVLLNIRKAVGYSEFTKLKHGVVVQEVPEGRDVVSTHLYGSAGQFREEPVDQSARPLGFDGKYGWSIDRTGFPTPMPQRLREKILIPVWVRIGWWLNDNAPLVRSILANESTGEQVALSLSFKNGLVGGKLFVDRQTWLPEKLIVEYEHGPYTVEYKNYEPLLGLNFARRTSVNYRGSTTVYRVKSITEIPKSEKRPFDSPPPPDDTSFNNQIPADLQVAQGTAFSAESEGHYYVRPMIDGKEMGWFNFDSGSDSMQIDAKLADELNLPVLGKSQIRGADGKVQEVTIRRGKTFQLGRVTISNPTFLARDLSASNAPPGQKRAGVVGYPLFARVVAAVVKGGEKIALYDSQVYKLSGGRWQELYYIDLTPAVNCRFEGNREALFQVDTGYSGTVTFYRDFVNAEKLLEGRHVTEEEAIGAGGTYKSFLGTIEWFEIAGHRFEKPKAEFRMGGFSREGGAGVIGRDFIKPFTIVFNYPLRRIAII